MTLNTYFIPGSNGKIDAGGRIVSPNSDGTYTAVDAASEAALSQLGQLFTPALAAQIQALVSGGGIPPWTKHPQLASFKAALLAARAGTADCKVAFVGDSTTMGAWGAGSGYTGARPFCRADKFADFLRASGFTAYKSSYWGDSYTNTLLAAYDTRITRGTNWVSNFLSILGGTSNTHNTNGSFTTISFAPTEIIDTVDVYYITNTGYGSCQVLVDGVVNGAALTGAGSLAVVKATRTFSAGVHAIGIQKTVDGTFHLLGVDCYNASAKGVRCWQMGAGGVKASDVAAAAAVYDPTSLLKTYAPDLTVINLGINDWLNATAPATYQAAISTIVDAARLSGDVLIEVPVASSYASTSQANQELITFALRQTAANKGVPIADLNAAMRNYTSATTAGYFLPASDLIHPGPTGYQFMANVLADALFK